MFSVYVKAAGNKTKLETEFKARGLDPICLSRDQDIAEAVALVAHAGGRVDAIYLQDDGFFDPDGKTVAAILRLRKLPDDLTFASGLKVRTLPIILSVHMIQDRVRAVLDGVGVLILEPQYSVKIVGSADEELIELSSDATSPLSFPATAADSVLLAIRSFKRSLVDEFDNAGLAAVIEGESLRIKIALTTKGVIDTEHFYWPKKLKPQVLFLGPDVGKLSRALAQYEKLINKKDVSEREMQNFFEKNPEFVLGSKFQKLWSQFVFPDDLEHEHRTDFLLQPQVYPQISANWEILEIKKPSDRLVTRSGLHPGFSAKVHAGIRQLHDYSERFRKNPEFLMKKLGHRVTHPRLALLIGKKMEVDPVVLAREEKENPDVRLISYDEIQEEQMRRFAAVFSANPLL